MFFKKTVNTSLKMPLLFSLWREHFWAQNRPYSSLWKSQGQSHGRGEWLGGDTVLTKPPPTSPTPLPGRTESESGPITGVSQHPNDYRPDNTGAGTSTQLTCWFTAGRGLRVSQRHPLWPRGDQDCGSLFLDWGIRGPEDPQKKIDEKTRKS